MTREFFILTRGDGTPIERPTPPARDASIDESIDYIRAIRAYNDEVTDVANVAFSDSFKKTIKETV